MVKEPAWAFGHVLELKIHDTYTLNAPYTAHWFAALYQQSECKALFGATYASGRKRDDRKPNRKNVWFFRLIIS